MGIHLSETTRQYSYADYLAWTGEHRWELINGTAYNMSPAPSVRHQEVVGAVFAQLHAALEGDACAVYVAPFDVRLGPANASDNEIYDVLQPDISVVCDSDKLDEHGCEGAPDVIIEVLSPSTAPKDLIVKRELYGHYGVREYWAVHPLDRVVTIYRLEPEGGFAPPEIRECKGTIEFTALPGVVIDMNRVFPGIVQAEQVSEGPVDYVPVRE